MTMNPWTTLINPSAVLPSDPEPGSLHVIADDAVPAQRAFVRPPPVPVKRPQLEFNARIEFERDGPYLMEIGGGLYEIEIAVPRVMYDGSEIPIFPRGA